MKKNKTSPIGVLLVCLGNICRSPTAEAIFTQQVEQAGLASQFMIDSAGTGDWHVGQAPDQRALRVAQQRGYVMEHLRARQVADADFQRFDYILAMDEQNLSDLKARCPMTFHGELKLFLSYREQTELAVPDPYDLAGDAFETMVDLIEQGSRHLLTSIIERESLFSGPKGGA